MCGASSILLRSIKAQESFNQEETNGERYEFPKNHLRQNDRCSKEVGS